jgi:ABC-type oligopeptide transport system substrate-binding subunit
MNMKKILLSIFALATVAVAMVSCGDDNYAEPGNSDVSALASGIYVGNLTTQDETAPLTGEDLTVTVTNDEGVERVNTVTLTGTVTNPNNGRSFSINDTKTFNSMLANGSYLLTNPKIALAFGKVIGDEIQYTVKITPAGKITAAGKFYTVVAKRVVLDEE